MKSIAFMGLILAILLVSACAPKQPSQGDGNLGGTDSRKVVEYTVVGGFIMPTMYEKTLVIAGKTAIYTVKDSDGQVTSTEEIELSDAQYDELIKVFEDNDFFNLEDEYILDPLTIADLPDATISYTSEGTKKTIELKPNAPWEYDQRLANIEEVLQEIVNMFYDDVEPVDDTVTLSYQPMQCEKNPWDVWYETSPILFIKEPTQEELIVIYYGSAHQVDVFDVQRLESDVAVCEACGVCPVGYSFTASTLEENAGVLEADGWV